MSDFDPIPLDEGNDDVYEDDFVDEYEYVKAKYGEDYAKRLAATGYFDGFSDYLDEFIGDQAGDSDPYDVDRDKYEQGG